MRIVATLPRKRSWTVVRLTWPDGRVHLLTDWVSTRRPLPDEVKYQKAIEQGAAVDRVDGPIVEAAIRIDHLSDNFVFAERDNGNRWEFSASETANVLRAISDGRLKLVDGWFIGRFYFKKQGSMVLMYLHDEPVEALGEAPAGAVDLSDLVATLGPAK